VGVSADDSREQYNGLGQIVYLHGLGYVLLVVQQLPHVPDLVGNVLPVALILPFFCDEAAQFGEDGADLKGVDPFLEEPGVPRAEVGGGAVGVCEVEFHDVLHDHQVGLVVGGFIVAAVVQAEADVDVVETDFLVEVEVKNVESDAQQHLDLV
jgi:hypothetical protein